MIILNLWVVFLIAISLSMDAFSVSISLGTLSLVLRERIILSVIVGLFHFFMPLFGSICSFVILNNTHIDLHLLSGIIFLYIGIQMLKDFKYKGEISFKNNYVGFLFFAFGVSLDSFGVGITLPMNFDLIICLPMFSLCSASLTFTGLYIGTITHKLLGQFATILGAVIMFLLALTNFVNFCCF